MSYKGQQLCIGFSLSWYPLCDYMSNIEQTTISPSDKNTAPASGQANGATHPVSEGFDSWIKNFQKYESILVGWFQMTWKYSETNAQKTELAKVSADTKFKDELDTIEKCL